MIQLVQPKLLIEVPLLQNCDCLAVTYDSAYTQLMMNMLCEACWWLLCFACMCALNVMS